MLRLEEGHNNHCHHRHHPQRLAFNQFKLLAKEVCNTDLPRKHEEVEDISEHAKIDANDGLSVLGRRERQTREENNS